MPGGIFAAFLIVFGVFLVPHIAQADPHAMFYTAIGQRQLFFNFLAALDQADYVEPATGNFSREELLLKRNQAILSQLQAIGLPVDKSYIDRQDPALQATNTNLSAIVTRPVTLEGSDQFSSQLLFDHSREIARRAGTAALLAEVFCDQALGRDKCGSSASDIAQRDRGFVADPNKFATYPMTHGAVANLTSGEPGADAARNEVLKEARNGFVPGYMYDPFISDLRKNLQESGSTEALEDFNALVISTIASMYPLPVHPETYDGLEVTEDGGIEIAYSPFDSRNSSTALAASAPNFAEGGYKIWYLNKLQQLNHLPGAVRDSADAGARGISTNLAALEDQGSVADVKQIVRAKPPEPCDDPDGFCPLPEEKPNANNLSIQPTVRVPVVGKTSQIETAIQALSDLNTNLASVGSPYRINDPIGNVPLLNPPPTVKGASTGSVLAETDGASGEQLRQIFGTSPYFGVNEIVPQGEGALRQFLLAIKGQPGCGCNISTVANAFGTPLINKINGLSL